MLVLLGAGCESRQISVNSQEDQKARPDVLQLESKAKPVGFLDKIKSPDFTIAFTKNDAQERAFADFFRQYMTALDKKDHAFLKKVHPPEYFEAIRAEVENGYSYDVLRGELEFDRMKTGEITVSCKALACLAMNDEAGMGLEYRLKNNQWLGYDPDWLAGTKRLKEALRDANADYQLNFSAFGPVKYVVTLNGAIVNDFVDMKSGASLGVYPYDLKMGKNTLVITAMPDRTSEQFNETSFKQGKLKARASYTVQRFPKNNMDPYGVLEDKYVLLKNGKTDPADADWLEFTVTSKGWRHEASFIVD